MQLRNWIPEKNGYYVPNRESKSQLTHEDVHRLNLRQPSVTRGNADLLFRILVVGEPGVGRTKLVHCFLRNNAERETARAAGTGSRQLRMHYDSLVKLEIDQPRNVNIWCHSRPEDINRVIGAVIVYDITNRESYEQVQKWFKAIRQFAHTHKFQEVLQLVGCKRDMVGRRQVDTAEAENWAYLNGMSFYETSALTGENVELAFLNIADQMLRKLESGDFVYDPKQEGVRFTSSLERIQSHPYIEKLCTTTLETMSVARAEQIRGDRPDWVEMVRLRPITYLLGQEESEPLDLEAIEQDDEPLYLDTYFPPPGRRQRHYTDNPQYAKGHEPWNRPGISYPEGEVDANGKPSAFHLWSEYVPYEPAASTGEQADASKAADKAGAGGQGDK